MIFILIIFHNELGKNIETKKRYFYNLINDRNNVNNFYHTPNIVKF